MDDRSVAPLTHFRDGWTIHFPSHSGGTVSSEGTLYGLGDNLSDRALHAFNTVFKSAEHIIKGFFRQLGIEVWARKQAQRTALVDRKRRLEELSGSSKRMRSDMR